MIFVGNMVNPTNIEGIKWFLQKVMPLILERDPHMRITIIGHPKSYKVEIVSNFLYLIYQICETNLVIPPIVMH